MISKNKFTKMGKDTCPCCGTMLDAATAIKEEDEEHAPKPKDLTICVECGEILYYSEDMKLEKFPEILFNEMDKETQLILNRAKILINARKAKKA